jgi:hypothetical protein
MKKTKKIPYTPKYKFGGFEKTIFTPDADDKKKMKKFGKQAGTAAYGVGEGVLDTVTMGATDQLTDKGYTALQKAGNSTEDEMREQNSIRGFGNAGGAAIGFAVNPGAGGAAISQAGKGLGAGVSEGNKSKGWAQDAGMALTTAGKVGSMAYGMAGSPMTPGMEAQASSFNSSDFGQGLGKYNKFMGQGNAAGGMEGSEEGMGGMGSPLGIMNMLSGMGGMGAGTEMPINKYGGYMKYDNGGLTPKQVAAADQAFGRINHYERRGSGDENAITAYKAQIDSLYRNPKYDIVNKIDSLNKVYPTVNNDFEDVPFNTIFNPDKEYNKNLIYKKENLSGASIPYMQKNEPQNLNKFEITILNGMIILGKYTFPKILELSRSTVDVFVKQSAK